MVESLPGMKKLLYTKIFLSSISTDLDVASIIYVVDHYSLADRDYNSFDWPGGRQSGRSNYDVKRE